MMTSSVAVLKLGSKYSTIWSPIIGMDGITVVRRTERNIFNVLGFHFPTGALFSLSVFGVLSLFLALPVVSLEVLQVAVSTVIACG